MGQRLTYLFLFFLCLNATLLSIAYHSDTPFKLALWASAILWLNIAPIVHYLLVGHKREIFPYLPILGFFITLTYSLPVFFIRPTSYEIAPLTEKALNYAFFGYFTFYFFYFLSYPLFQFKKCFDVIAVPVTSPRVHVLALFFLAIFVISSKIYTIASLKYIGDAGIFIYLGTYLYLFGTKVRVPRWEKALYYFILAEEFVSAFLSGQFAGLALMSLFLSIVIVLVKIGFRKVIFLSVIFLIFYYFFAPVKYKYRDKVWYSHKEVSLTERINLVIELIGDTSNYNKTKLPENYKDRMNVLWRPSYDASALSLVTAKTPSEIPFTNGSTYIFLPKLIPRVFWPNKPTEDASLDFAHRYHLVNHLVTISPYPLPILAEMYMNYGEMGILIGMLCLSILYNVLNSYFNNNRIHSIGKIYGISIIFPYIYHEGNLTMTFGNIPLLTLCIYIICRVFQVRIIEMKRKLPFHLRFDP
ncbi:MAG: hypothetical protein JST68_10290 [Bacteroidetes bacterium]|nr:hypothetical protein [Bacteroidota bacterium]